MGLVPLSVGVYKPGLTNWASSIGGLRDSPSRGVLVPVIGSEMVLLSGLVDGEPSESSRQRLESENSRDVVTSGFFRINS